MTFFNRGRSARVAKGGIGLFAFFSFAAGFVLLATLPTPYLIERPGPSYDVLGELSGEPIIEVIDQPSYESTGKLDVLTVSVVGRPERTPSWFELGLAWLDQTQKVVPIESIYPPDRTSEQVRAESSAMMEISQQDAIAAALSYLGYQTPREIYISQVSSDSAASGKLVAADFVISVNGERLSSIEQLRGLVGSWDEVAPLDIGVIRDGKPVSQLISPIRDSGGDYRLGILVGYRYDFPVQVKLQLGDVGGPSGGMMFALGIIERMTSEDITGGLHVAGTGTILESGEVGAIGGVVQKMHGAKRSGADVFLAPAGNCAEIAGNEPSGLRVVRIEKLAEAIAVLEKLSKNKDLADLPSCSR